MLRRWGEARARLGLQHPLRLTGPEGHVHGALSRALRGLGFSAEGWGTWRSAQGSHQGSHRGSRAGARTRR
eukprot:10506822-Alexandrium_andersonii.AAC.1